MSYYSDVVIEVPLEEYEYWLSLDDHDLQTTLEFADLNATTVTNDTRVLGWKCLAWEDDCKDAGIKWTCFSEVLLL